MAKLKTKRLKEWEASRDLGRDQDEPADEYRGMRIHNAGCRRPLSQETGEVNAKACEHPEQDEAQPHRRGFTVGWYLPGYGTG